MTQTWALILMSTVGLMALLRVLIELHTGRTERDPMEPDPKGDKWIFRWWALLGMVCVGWLIPMGFWTVDAAILGGPFLPLAAICIMLLIGAGVASSKAAEYQ